VRPVEEIEKEISAVDDRSDRRAADQVDPGDCFLSSWADGITRSKLQYELEIAKNGGLSEFPALFDLDGNRVPAKLINAKYGQCWALLDENWRFIGFVSRPRLEPVKDPANLSQWVYQPTKRSAANLRKKGFVEGVEMAPARAQIVGSGHGLSGSAWATIVRADRGCPAEIVEKNCGLDLSR